MTEVMKKAAVKSWQTTAAGWCAFVAAAAHAAQMLLDGDPATNPEWTVVATALFLALGLTAARDSGVSSEDAGAK